MAHGRLGAPLSRTLLIALLAAAGCASEHPAPVDCGIDPTARPLGRKIIPFIAWVRSRPEATVEEFRTRDALLAEDGRAVRDRVGEEARRTGDFVRRVPGAIGSEFRYRDALLADAIGRHGDRLREDTHCFLTRAWNSLKLLE